MNTRLGLNVHPNPKRKTLPASGAAGVACAATVLACLLSGCATNGILDTGTGGSTIAPAVHMTGRVHGGQQPVAGATIQLYAVGTTATGAPATALIANPPTTNANGYFNLTGSYSCANASDVYIVATAGSPTGTLNGAINPNLALVAALGDCATLKANAATTIIQMNEVTTVAAAYALAPFATDMTHVGANFGSATTVPTGLATAFANAKLLADTTAGASPGSGLAPGVVVPSTEINTLSNIIAACINSTGAGSPGCTPLFNATGANDTFTATLAIAKNSGAPAITALCTSSSGTAPFQPSMPCTSNSLPNDFSIAVTFTGGASSLLSTPYAVALDASGNAWVTNASSTQVTVLSPTGVGANVTAPGLYGAQGVAVDQAGNVWVANTAGNSVLRFAAGYTPGGAAPAATAYTAGGVLAPSAIAIDSANNIFVTNFNGNSVTGLTSAGAALSGSPFTGSNGNITVPTSIAVSPAGTGGNLVVSSGSGNVVMLSNAGAYLSSLTDNTLQGPVSLAYNSGNLAVSGFTTGTAVGGALSEFGSSGTAATVSPIMSGLATPGGVASDGTSFWVANSTPSGGLAKYVYGAATQASPANGYGSLGTPVGVAVDASGSVWTANSSAGTVSKFIGMATPAAMPLVVNAGP